MIRGRFRGTTDRALGSPSPRLPRTSPFLGRLEAPYREGVVYYLRDGRVRGVLLWNVWEQVDAARKLIGEPGPFRPESLKGRLPAYTLSWAWDHCHEPEHVSA
jgi:hypothetical protein